jgi:hypothetical protein
LKGEAPGVPAEESLPRDAQNMVKALVNYTQSTCSGFGDN